MKYYITDKYFNILSIHADRESGNREKDAKYQAGEDVVIDSEERLFKALEKSKAIDLIKFQALAFKNPSGLRTAQKKKYSEEELLNRKITRKDIYG
tara:strand:- start:57 stop:344 length:288 start_codon:yes stop_codon:yes gene_type:complete